MPNNIGATLKKYRNDSKITVKQISDILLSEGYKATESTIYSWENGNSQPTPGALLTMCRAYGIKDVLSAFGYDGYDEDGRILLNMYELDIIEKYRSLDESGKKAVDAILNNEYDRCHEFEQYVLSGELTIYDYLGNTPEERNRILYNDLDKASAKRIIDLLDKRDEKYKVRSQSSTANKLNAAHTMINSSDEDKKHDEDIMNEDDF